MMNAFSVLLPIFLLIWFGYCLKHIRFPSSEFWSGAERLVYYILFPALLVYKLATADVDVSAHINLLLTAGLGLTLVFVLLILCRKWIHTPNQNLTSVIQGSIRFNTYVFLALVFAFYGAEGLILAAVLIAFVIPLINVLCILGFALLKDDYHASFWNVVRSIFKNPLIVACLIGLLIQMVDFPVPGALLDSLEILSRAALPFGLLCVGIGLELEVNWALLKDMAIATIAKFAMLPVLLLFLSQLAGLSQIETAILLLFSVMPTATSSYILAKELGGNARLMASIITVQTLLSFLIIPMSIGR